MTRSGAPRGRPPLLPQATLNKCWLSLWKQVGAQVFHPPYGVVLAGQTLRWRGRRKQSVGEVCVEGEGGEAH